MAFLWASAKLLFAKLVYCSRGGRGRERGRARGMKESYSVQVLVRD